MASNPWFPSSACRPQGRLQLFCFPCAGRGATLFRTWCDELPASVEVWPIEYPGHESRFRERPFQCVDLLAEELADAVAQEIAMPFAFFGHSLGAILAFETARRLRDKHGQEPCHLFVSSMRAPQLPYARPEIRDAPDAEFLRELRVYGGTRDEVLANEELMRLLSPVLRADFCMSETYAYQPQPPLRAPITAFGGLTDVTVPWHRLHEWSVHTQGDFRLHLLPGGHFFLDTAQATLLALLRDACERPPAAAVSIPPRRDEVHLWRIRLGLSTDAVTRLAGLLTPDERARGDAFVLEEDRVRHIVTRAALRLILARYVGQLPANLRFGYGRYGKPFLLDPPEAKEIGFNVAHSGEWALIAVARGQAVGVDVERKRPGRDLADVGQRVFAPAECQHLRSLTEKDRLDAFYELWVRKEACLKCSGLGFAGGSADSAAPFLANLSPGDGYAGAIAAEQGCSSLLCRELELA
jgi:medium-chain acyl-[acyl-carrier-protein] hydrolase